MKRGLGHILQAAGLLIVGWGLMVGLVQDAIATEVAFMFLGAACFIVGRALSGGGDS